MSVVVMVNTPLGWKSRLIPEHILEIAMAAHNFLQIFVIQYKQDIYRCCLTNFWRKSDQNWWGLRGIFGPWMVAEKKFLFFQEKRSEMWCEAAVWPCNKCCLSHSMHTRQLWSLIMDVNNKNTMLDVKRPQRVCGPTTRQCWGSKICSLIAVTQ